MLLLVTIDSLWDFLELLISFVTPNCQFGNCEESDGIVECRWRVMNARNQQTAARMTDYQYFPEKAISPTSPFTSTNRSCFLEFNHYAPKASPYAQFLHLPHVVLFIIYIATILTIMRRRSYFKSHHQHTFNPP